MKRLYDQYEVSRIVGVSPARVRLWERQGLIPSREKRRGRLAFDFRGLVALRTVKKLRSQGVSLGRIKKCAERLRRLLPDSPQPLAEARVSLVQEQLILGRGRRRLTPEGQLLLDFGPGPAPGPRALPPEAYEALFFQALEDEEAGRWDAARRKYELILAALPEHVDALVNLGNILHLSAGDTRAAALYLKALGIEPQHVEANYNLANLLEDRGELQSAIAYYRRALCGDPDFAPAHFNLAVAWERLGDRAQARVHWRRYLALEPEGLGADFIRQRLEEE
jgi:tetratricopeptide (TPR) repeat protein